MVKLGLELACFFIIFSGAVHARFSLKNNVSPTKGILGVSVGILKPIAGDGQLFNGSEDAPHGDYGFSLGLDYWKSNLNSFEYHLGIKAKYAQYHFHHTPQGGSELTGYFNMLYYSLPFSIHLSLPHYSYLQAVGGVAVASMNMLGVKSGNTSSYSYSSDLDLKWVVSPELFLGVNFMEEKTDILFFKGSIIYSTFPMRNLSHAVTLSDNGTQFSSASAMPASKIELVLTIYPKWKTKKSFSNDEGINCPTSF